VTPPDWWPPRRRLSQGDEVDDASASQRLKSVEKRVGWLYAGLATIAATALGSGAAYYRTWEASVAQRAAASAAASVRLDRVERDVAELRATFFSLFPLIPRNPPAMPASPGDDR
jgi:hypothetical protein